MFLLAKHKCAHLLREEERTLARGKLYAKLASVKRLRSIFATAQVAIHNVATPERAPSDFLLDESIFLRLGVDRRAPTTAPNTQTLCFATER